MSSSSTSAANGKNSSTNITKRLHISFAPSLPSSGSAVDLRKSLSAHFGKFGTVKSVDGFVEGQVDGVGVPRKFGYVTIEGQEGGIARCVNSLSGSIWKGVKVRVGDAKPDFKQRIAQDKEKAADPAPSRKRKRSGGFVHAADMTLVTPENAPRRAGWKVTEMGRVLRPMRMRPEHPLPPPLAAAAAPKKLAQKDGDKVKPTKKRRRESDSRARRKTIDVTRWGSTHLKGVFLENTVVVPHTSARDDLPELSSDSESEDEAEDSPPAVLKKSTTKTTLPAEKPRSTAAIASAPPIPVPVSLPAPASNAPASRPPAQTLEIDLALEKYQTLSLLGSLFGGGDAEWGGRESVGSDVDEEELLKIGGIMDGEEDGIETVPMEVDANLDLERREPERGGAEEVAVGADEEEEETAPPSPPPKEGTRVTALKDLFTPREEDADFSLLGHLDLDLELDDELAHLVLSGDSGAVATAGTSLEVPQTATTALVASGPSHAHVAITLDPKTPLFFPLSTSFSFSSSSLTSNNYKARQRDILDVGKDNGWNVLFSRGEGDTTEDAEEEEKIKAKWESERGELTRGWKKRWREAGKVRKRRGGGADAE